MRRCHGELVFVLASALVPFVACGPLGPSGSGAVATSSEGGSDDPSGGGGGGGGSGEPGLDSGTRPGVGGGSPSDRAAPGGYYVNGPKVYDSNQAPHVFRGVDRPSLEWNPLGENLSAEDYKNMAKWNANVVRIALNQGFWMQSSKHYASGYKDTVDQNVKWAEAAGMDVILDLHWSDRGDSNTKPDQQRMADANSITFWKEVAAKYKSDGHVLFELYNEPHDVSWDVWQSGGASGDGFSATGMQQLYDAVRSTGAENVVLIGGLDWAFDLSQVASHRIKGYNIVYATHPYDKSGKQPERWDAMFGNLAKTDPVMATEFGNTDSCDTSYLKKLVDYMGARDIHWSGWAWYVSDCRFPALISDWKGIPTAAGQLVKDALNK